MQPTWMAYDPCRGGSTWAAGPEYVQAEVEYVQYASDADQITVDQVQL